MHLTEVHINLCPAHAGRLRAYCSLTFDNAFVIRDVKLIEGNDGLFLAMPSRKLSDHCPRCGDKNHLRAKYCNNCGVRLNEHRHAPTRDGLPGRMKLHADIAHPIHPEVRLEIEQQVLAAYEKEKQRAALPGYVPPSLEGEDSGIFDAWPESTAAHRPGAS